MNFIKTIFAPAAGFVGRMRKVEKKRGVKSFGAHTRRWSAKDRPGVLEARTLEEKRRKNEAL